MKYKNIVFDFGNVIGRFDGKAILSEFCPYEEELDYLSEIVYKRWAELDAGTLDYDSYINEIIDQVPEHLKASAGLQQNGHAALLYFRIPLHLSMN